MSFHFVPEFCSGLSACAASVVERIACEADPIDPIRRFEVDAAAAEAEVGEEAVNGALDIAALTCSATGVSGRISRIWIGLPSSTASVRDQSSGGDGERCGERSEVEA